MASQYVPVIDQDRVSANWAHQLLDEQPRSCVFCGRPITHAGEWCFFASEFSVHFMCRFCECASAAFEPKGNTG